ncbi:MAG: immunoglobulin domain-containing protein [Opitutaceae bacterium]|jgi:hypothetical protein
MRNLFSPFFGITGFAVAAVLVPHASAQPTVAITPSSGGYSAAGGSITFTVELTYAVPQSALGFTVVAPANWSYGATGGPNSPSVTPNAGDSGEFDFAYTSIPASPVSFSFTATYPAGLTGSQSFGSISGYFRPSSGSGLQTIPASNVVLTLALSAPTITTQPAGQSVSVGANVTFTVAATGSGPFTYQWEKNGSPISGATSSSLSLSSVQTSDTGNYSAVVKDANGLTTTSTAASLSVSAVLSPQTITFSPIGSVAIDVPVSLKATSSSGLSVAFAVQSGNATITGGSTLTLLDANPVTVVASCPGNSTYSAAPNVTQTVTAVSSGNIPVIGTQPASQTANAGAGVTLSVAASSNSSLTYQWKLNGVNIPGATGATLSLSNVGTTQAGSYTVVVTNQYSSVTSNAGIVTVAVTTHPINISSRAYVGTGSQVLVIGFVISGQSSETILIRGDGPSLSQQGVLGVLATPQLTLYDISGNVIATNIGWGNAPAAGSSTVASDLQSATSAIFSSVYAFALPSGSADCALVATLPPGAYTAQVSGVGGTTGVALMEVYDVP